MFENTFGLVFQQRRKGKIRHEINIVMGVRPEDRRIIFYLFCALETLIF